MEGLEMKGRKCLCFGVRMGCWRKCLGGLEGTHLLGGVFRERVLGRMGAGRCDPQHRWKEELGGEPHIVCSGPIN